jgi:hypothetical protein
VDQVSERTEAWECHAVDKEGVRCHCCEVGINILVICDRTAFELKFNEKRGSKFSEKVEITRDSR